MCRTGYVTGSNWPTAFLFSGKRKSKVFSDDFLAKFGAAHGRTIAMIDSGHMNDES